MRNLQVGLRVWSGGEIFIKKNIKTTGAHKAPPPLITKVNKPVGRYLKNIQMKYSFRR